MSARLQTGALAVRSSRPPNISRLCAEPNKVTRRDFRIKVQERVLDMNWKCQVLGKYREDINSLGTSDLAVRSQYNLERVAREGLWECLILALALEQSRTRLAGNLELAWLLRLRADVLGQKKA